MHHRGIWVAASRKAGRSMKIGVPREVKNHEYRIAITPAGVRELTGHGHEVFVEKDAGAGSELGDDAYVAAGATIIPDPDEVWRLADMVLKVKEPIAEEYHRMRPGQVLYTYLHLAPDPEQSVITVAGLEIDLIAHVVRRDGEPVHLTRTEFDLLRMLVLNRGRLLTHPMLLAEVWGPGYADDVQVLRTHVARLRAKIDPAGSARRHYIRTETGIGYRFDPK